MLKALATHPDCDLFATAEHSKYDAGLEQHVDHGYWAGQIAASNSIAWHRIRHVKAVRARTSLQCA